MMITTREQLEAAGREAKFPKGTPADPTSKMSPEAKAKWEAMNEEHGGKFKQGNGDMLQYFADNPDKLREKKMRDKAKKTGDAFARGFRGTIYIGPKRTGDAADGKWIAVGDRRVPRPFAFAVMASDKRGAIAEVKVNYPKADVRWTDKWPAPNGLGGKSAATKRKGKKAVEFLD